MPEAPELNVLGTLQAAGDSVPEGYRSLADSVIEQLHGHLDDCLVYTTTFDVEDNLYKIVAARGGEKFGGLEAGVELPLDRTFCFRMATDQAPRFAPDASEVSAFAELDPEGAFAAYAGSPIEFADGTRVGSLCVVAGAPGGIPEVIVPMISVLASTLATALEKENEVQRLREANVSLVEQATTDSLTGVANRRSFEADLLQSWQLAQRGTMASYLFLADLDKFKSLNDEHGHLVGDLALVALADTLKEASRESDTVGRVGGDEFAVVLHGCGSDDEAAGFRERVQRQFRGRVAAHSLDSTVSIGFADLGEAQSPERAVEAADIAMYDDKAA